MVEQVTIRSKIHRDHPGRINLTQRLARQWWIQRGIPGCHGSHQAEHCMQNRTTAVVDPKLLQGGLQKARNARGAREKFGSRPLSFVTRPLLCRGFHATPLSLPGSATDQQLTASTEVQQSLPTSTPVLSVQSNY